MSEQEPVKKTKLKEYLKDLENRLSNAENGNKQFKDDIAELKKYNAELKAERDRLNENNPNDESDDPDNWNIEDL